MQHVLLTDPKDDALLVNGEVPYVAAGSAGDVLTSGGAAVAPTMQTPSVITLGVTPVTGTTDALPKQGVVMIGATGVDNCTLATPTAGAPGVGDDGKLLVVFDVGGHAHTITTAANKIVPSHDTLTFNGTAGSWIRLRAYNGLWYPEGLLGATATEV